MSFPGMSVPTEVKNTLSAVVLRPYRQLAEPLRAAGSGVRALAEQSVAVGSRIPWDLRRRLWNGLATFKFRNKPAVVPVPKDEGRPLIPVPFVSEFPGIPIDGIFVADHVPRDEVTVLNVVKRLVSEFQVGMFRWLPPMQTGLPSIPADPDEALAGAYTDGHRRRFPPPRRPPEYSDGIDLGQLAVASPYACYLQASDDGSFRWDLVAREALECHPGLRPPWAVVEFRLDPQKGRLEAVRIQSELVDSASPGDSNWETATRLALCAATTHLSLVRHFNWIHLVVGGPLAMITRNHLPARHPVRLLLWAHVYGTQYSNQVVTAPQMAPGGDFESVFSYTHRGMCQLFESTVDDFDLQMIEPSVDATRRGIVDAGFETPALGNRLELMNVLREHASRYLVRYFPDDEALAGDEPFRHWLDEVERSVRGARELVGGEVTLAGAARLLSTLIYLVTVEHEIVGSGLWNYQLWSDAHPVRVYQDGSLPPLDVYQRLVNADFILNVPRTPLLSDFSGLARDAAGAEAFARFLADLWALQIRLDRQPAACWRITPKDLKANINA